MPGNDRFVCNHAASVGLDGSSFLYANNVGAASLGTNADANIFDHYRDEFCFSMVMGGVVNVNSSGSK